MKFKPVHARPRGVALISVLLVVAVLLAVAANLMTRHSLVISQNFNAFSQAQALQYALGAESLARQVLGEDFTSGAGEVDHLGENWAQPVMPFELDEGGYLEAQISDLQGCFNLNNLSDSGAEPLERARRLMTNLAIAPQLADAWKDWVDTDDVITGFGAEDSEYLISEIPHRTPNLKVFDSSELRALKDADPDEVAVLLPEVCALPFPGTKLNVNTARVHALAALDDNLAPGNLAALVESERSYEDVNDFLADNPDFDPVKDQLAVKSEYFAVHAIAQVGDSSLTIYSMIHRNPTDGKITVLSRNFGKLFQSNIEVDSS